MTEPLVAVIVLTWNRVADTLECLESLIKQSYPNIKIVVVDNGSTDGSVDAIGYSFPAVSVIENGINLGFSRGNNIGIHDVLEQGAGYVLLLNNDTVADPDLVKHLTEAAQTDPSIGAAGPKILYHADPSRLWSAGGQIRFTETISQMRGYRQRDRGQFDRVEPVDYLPGCALLMRRETLEQVGLLDPVYSPAYFEDTDWCMRARKGGYRILYVPAAKVWHKVSLSSGGEYNPRERYWLAFHSVTFMRRYARPTQWMKYILYAVGSWPFVFVYRLACGQGRAAFAKLTGLFDGLRGAHRDAFTIR